MVRSCLLLYFYWTDTSVGEAQAKLRILRLPEPMVHLISCLQSPYIAHSVQRCQIIVIIELLWIVYSLCIYHVCCLYAHGVVFICSGHMHIIFLCIIIKTLPGVLSHFPATIRSLWGCDVLIYVCIPCMWLLCSPNRTHDWRQDDKEGLDRREKCEMFYLIMLSFAKLI